MSGRRWTAGLLVLVAALLLRGAWVAAVCAQRGAALEYPDEQVHWQLACNLLKRGALMTDDARYAARMPVYPLFLTPFALLGDSGVCAARAGQALLGALAAWLAYAWARAALGGGAGFVAGLLVAVDPFGVFFCGLLLTETLFTTLLLATLFAVWRVPGCTDEPPMRGAARDMLRRAALAGLCAGGLLMTRPSAAGLVGLLVLLVVLFRGTWQARVQRAAVLSLVVAAMLLPWGARNHLALGGPAWLSSNGGVTLYDAQGPQARGDSDQSFLHAMPDLLELDELEQDDRLRSLALTQMRSDPARVASLAWTKFLRMWNPIPNVAEHRGGWTAVASAVYTVALLLGAAFALARSRMPAFLHALLWTPLVYFTLLHCIYIGSVRYRVPLMPLLAMACAAGATHRKAEVRISNRE